MSDKITNNTPQSLFNRRASDFTNGGHQPTMMDVWGLLIEIRDRLDDVERLQDTQSTAFPVDDLQKPDYSGHRRAHVDMIKSEQLMDDYKSDATKEIVKMIVVFVVGLIANGFISKLLPLIPMLK